MTDDAIASALESVSYQLERITMLLQAQAEAGGWAPLYCRPSEEYHCPGGFPLRHHAREYWKNDGKDQDRFFHELPESAWHPYEGKGELHGRMVRNHNVWRSAATTDPTNGAAPFLDEPDPPGGPEARQDGRSVDQRTGEVRGPSDGVPTTRSELQAWALERHGMSPAQITEVLHISPTQWAKMGSSPPEQIERAYRAITAAVSR